MRKKPSKEEREALVKIGTHPVTVPKRHSWDTPTVTEVKHRTGQTFLYHTCNLIAESWPGVADDLNELQRDLEALYGPFVELVSTYRRFTTKNGGQVMVAIFKVFLGNNRAE